ncbi:hypothetical protein HYX06_04720 [Candidatus Woesearchaeota archaeon]|nr:hypothetical protein [Candidatus Woesearchaeota archaeon]
MNKEAFNSIKEESKYIGILFIAAWIIFKIIYFKESFIVLLKIVASLFWLFAVPGYFAMIYWKEKLEFAERFVIGILLSAAIMGIFSYYFGLMGLNMRYHGFILPPVIIIIGLIAAMKKKASSS